MPWHRRTTQQWSAQPAQREQVGRQTRPEQEQELACMLKNSRRVAAPRSTGGKALGAAAHELVGLAVAALAQSTVALEPLVQAVPLLR